MQLGEEGGIMANSDTLLMWVIYLQFAFFLLPGIAWVVDRAINGPEKNPPAEWGRRVRRRRPHHLRHA